MKTNMLVSNTSNCRWINNDVEIDNLEHFDCGVCQHHCDKLAMLMDLTLKWSWTMGHIVYISNIL